MARRAVLAADGALGELDVYTEALVAASPDPSTNDADASTAPVPDPASEGFTCAELASALDHIAFDRLQAIIQREEVDRGLEVMGTMRQVVVASAGADVRAFRVRGPAAPPSSNSRTPTSTTPRTPHSKPRVRNRPAGVHTGASRAIPRPRGPRPGPPGRRVGASGVRARRPLLVDRPGRGRDGRGTMGGADGGDGGPDVRGE